MYKVISLNVNGIRAAARKGFYEWLRQQNADVICLQEIKAQVDQLGEKSFWPENYFCEYLPAEKKGYSGVAIYSRLEPENIVRGLDWQEFDQEGRYLQFDFTVAGKKLSVASLYLPSGTSGEARQGFKYQAMERFEQELIKMKRRRREYIICGDWNIAHKNIDIKNWRANQKHSGFLPEERAWLDKLFDQLGFVDAFRVINQKPDQYTWWSNRGRAWDNNVGWRIDYQVLTPRLESSVRSTSIYKHQRFSDHAPLIIEYEI